MLWKKITAPHRTGSGQRTVLTAAHKALAPVRRPISRRAVVRRLVAIERIVQHQRVVARHVARGGWYELFGLVAKGRQLRSHLLRYEQPRRALWAHERGFHAVAWAAAGIEVVIGHAARAGLYSDFHAAADADVARRPAALEELALLGVNGCRRRYLRSTSARSTRGRGHCSMAAL